SLFVAMVINPALAAFLIKANSNNKSGIKLSAEEVAAAGDMPVAIKGPVLKVYSRLMNGALKNRIASILISFVLLILLFQVWLLVVGLEKPKEFFPDIEPQGMYVNIDMPEGANLDYVDRIIKEIEIVIGGVSKAKVQDRSIPRDELYRQTYLPKKHKKNGGEGFFGPSDLGNIEHVYAKSIAISGGASAFSPNTPNHVGIQFLEIEDRLRPTTETLEEIRKRTENIPGGKITVAIQENGPPTGAPINIEISGDDLKVLGSIAKKVRGIITNIPHVNDIRDDYVEGTPSVRVRVDRQKAALFGLSTNTIAFALKTGYNGLEVSTYRERDEDYDITLQLSDSDRRVTDILRELLIPTSTGKLVPLTTLATIDYSGGVGNIVRINHQRVVTVMANVDETKIPGSVARAGADEVLKELPLPPGYRIKFTGEFEFEKESEEFLSRAFMIAIFLIFMVLVSQFNSLSQPFIILTSVILSMGGAFLGLAVIKQPFGIIMTGVGVISLAGVVVNNAIVLIDYINKLIERGMNVHDAVVAGGATRLRPVVLTAITTILGLIPMVTGVSYDFHKWTISWVSESSQWWRSMAIVVIFGLMVSTFLTLIVVPALYSLLASCKEDSVKFAEWIKRIYWKLYAWLSGEGTGDDA
ncbi:MAG: efflux RND transporter permease subunit, partial [Thermodesulfobacteriota bacterium]